MKKTESNNLAEKTTTTVKLNQKSARSLADSDLRQDLGKTQEISEEAEIVNKSEIMDDIIKNNDKFETIRVLMEILCKELGISHESQFGEIHKALVGVTERYYKSMEDWKNLTKTGIKNDIRQ